MDVKMDHRTDARKETNILISPKPNNPKKSKEVLEGHESAGKCGEHSPGKCGEVRGSAGKFGDSKQHK